MRRCINPGRVSIEVASPKKVIGKLMARKGLYFRDVEPFIGQGDLTYIEDSDLIQIVRPCEVLAHRLVKRRRSKQYELVELEEKVRIDKGVLLASQWRAASKIEQERLASF